MFKEIIKSTYLLLFKCVFNIFSLYPNKKKTTYVVSFIGNPISLYQEMKKENTDSEVIFLVKPSVVKEYRRRLNFVTIIPFESPNILNWVRSIYHLATSKVLIVDNYFAFLSVINLKKGVECIQLWHAAGALKTFGLTDKSIANRSDIAKYRFKRVYKKFTKIIVGSDAMAQIFIRSFGVSNRNILNTGVPRTDFFYEKDKLRKAQSIIYQDYPFFLKKKVILYAPTFRDNKSKNGDISLDIKKMYAELKEEYVLLIKLHPSVKADIIYDKLYPNFVYNFSNFKGINRLLTVVDFLITDYSSIPFEFAILKKPMIFFPYDYESYMRERGVIPNYSNEVPGPILFDTSEIINVIKNNQFDLNLIESFSRKWNQYSDGSSSNRLVKYIKEIL